MWRGLLYNVKKVTQMKVNQSTLISEVAEETGFKVSDIKKIITSFVGVIRTHIIKGDIVNLTNFVKFRTEEVSSKKAYSFKLKTTSELPKRLLPKASFKPDFVQQIKSVG